MKRSSILLIGVGVSAGVGLLTWAFLSRRRKKLQARYETERAPFSDALHDMLNQKNKSRSFWQGQAKEWIEKSLSIPFEDARLEEFRKSLIYSLNQSEDDTQMSASTERVIWDILEAFGENRPAPGTPLH